MVFTSNAVSKAIPFFLGKMFVKLCCVLRESFAVGTFEHLHSGEMTEQTNGEYKWIVGGDSLGNREFIKPKLEMLALAGALWCRERLVTMCGTE